MKSTSEKGIALILTMLLVTVISIMGISLMFLSQSETWSSLNYRFASQARDAAEGAVNNVANYLMYSYTPAGAVSDPLTAYNTTVSPVQSPASNSSGHDVLLSANASVASNYPVSATQTAFNTSGVGNGSLTVGNTTVNYTTYARLLNMQQITPYLTSTAVTIQTWQITSDATISGVRSATEEVSVILERPIVSTFGYAAFATNTGCSALQFGGGGTTNSYDSSAALVSGVPVTSNTAGNIGTNGNLATNGNTTTINGNLSTPRTGTGNCTANNVTAWTANNGTVNGSLIELPQTVIYPTPDAPNPTPPTTGLTLNNGNCSGTPNCTGSSGNYTLTGGAVTGSACTGTPTTFGNITLNGGAALHLGAGCYNINSLKENGNSTIVVDSGPVIINIAGAGVTGNGDVVDLTGGGLTNTTGFDSSSFQIIYAGSQNIKLKGGAASAGLMYAPNASYSFGGGGDWYGSVIGATMTDMGGASVHYDRRLKDKYYMAGPFMLNSFTWNKS